MMPQNHTSARMVAGLMGSDPGIQARQGWSLPRGRQLDAISDGRKSIEFDHKAGVSPHLSSWIDYRLQRQRREAAVQKRKESLYGWALNKRKAMNGELNEFDGSGFDESSLLMDIAQDSFDMDNSFGNFDIDGMDSTLELDGFEGNMHPHIRKEFEHEANLMDRLRRHDDGSDGVLSPHRDLSARRPRPHFGGEMHNVVESDVEQRHGTAFRHEKKPREHQKSRQEMELMAMKRQSKMRGLLGKGMRGAQTQKHNDEIRRREQAYAEQLAEMKREMAAMKGQQMLGSFASKVRKSNVQSQRELELEAELKRHQQTAAMQKQSAMANRLKLSMKKGNAEKESDFLKQQHEAEQERLRREHEMELERMKRELESHKSNAQKSSMAKMMLSASSRANQEESKRRIAEEMAAMQAQQEEAHRRELEELQLQMQRDKDMHEHNLVLAQAEVQNVKSKLSVAEQEAESFKQDEAKQKAELDDMHRAEREHMAKLHEDELNKAKADMARKKFGRLGKAKTNLIKLKKQHEEELNQMKDKHSEDAEDLHLSLTADKLLVDHALKEEKEMAEYDATFNAAFPEGEASLHETTGDAHDDFAAVLADLGHHDLMGDGEFDAVDQSTDAPMEHHEFEGLLAQLESAHGETGGEIVDHDSELHGLMGDFGDMDGEPDQSQHMEDFLNSFGDFDDQSDFDSSSIVTGTDYTDSAAPSFSGYDEFGGLDNNRSAHEEMLRHHERSRQHENHLSNQAHEVNKTIAALQAASAAMD
jgi:hypothetical protein